jgi:hypothetical protein
MWLPSLTYARLHSEQQGYSQLEFNVLSSIYNAMRALEMQLLKDKPLLRCLFTVGQGTLLQHWSTISRPCTARGSTGGRQNCISARGAATAQTESQSGGDDLFSASHKGCLSSEGGIARAARGHEPRSLLAAIGQSEVSSELQVPIYGCFTEDFDTTDLKEAKALLAELA